MLPVRIYEKRTLVSFAWHGALLLVFTAGLYAEEGAGTLAAEATVYENDADDNGGGYTNVCIGNHETTDTTRRAFIRWNLPAIPAGSVITRVQLVLTQVRVRGMGAGSPKTATLQLRRVTQAWTEGSGRGIGITASCGGGIDVEGVNWSNAPTVDAAVSATEALPSSRNTAITVDTDVGTDDDALIDDLQFWLDNPESIFGWRLELTEEAITDNARRMTPGTLTVHWTGPVEPEVILSDGFETDL
jgi:hypothetical protein